MRDLRPPSEKRLKFMTRGWDHKIAKVWINQYSPKSAVCVRIWGEVKCSGARTSVSLNRTNPSLKSWTGLSTPPLALTEWDWLMGAGPKSQKCFDWPLTILGLDSEPWTSPWSAHHYRLSRLAYLIAMHCIQPQIKSWDCWERGAGSPLTFKVDKGFL